MTITSILLAIYGTCFISTLYLICVTNRLEKEAREAAYAKEVRQSMVGASYDQKENHHSIFVTEESQNPRSNHHQIEEEKHTKND